MKLHTTEFKSKRARDTVREMIRSGELVPGQRLESERTLSQKLGMTQMTVRRALQELVAEGIIVKQPRVGNFVGECLQTTRVAIILPRFMLDETPPMWCAGPGLAGISNLFEKREYSLQVLSCRPNNFWEDAGQIVLSNGIKGVLLSAGSSVRKEDIEKLISAGVKIVVSGVWEFASELGLPTVGIDVITGLRQILNRFIDLGHKRILYAKYTDSPSRKLEECLLESFSARLGIPLSEMVFNVPNHEASGKVEFSVLDQIFESPNIPTAIITADEYIAGEIFRLCYKRNIRIPEDMSLATRSNLSPMSLPVRLAGPDSIKLMTKCNEIAVSFLIKLLERVDVFEREVLLRCDIEWGESVSAVPNKNVNAESFNNIGG